MKFRFYTICYFYIELMDIYIYNLKFDIFYRFFNENEYS